MALRLATRGSALATAQASQVADLLGGAELAEAEGDGERGDKSRFTRGVERLLLAGEADRERLEAMAKAIASRLLHEPTLRMRRSAGGDDAYFYVSALRELFGLDVGTEPEGEAGANVTELRRTNPGRGSA